MIPLSGQADQSGRYFSESRLLTIPVQFELRLEKKSDQSQGYREIILGNKCVKKSPRIFF